METTFEPSLDVKEFRRALSLFPTGVAILTTVSEQGVPVGLTCNSFSSVSLEPPLVSWGLRKESRAAAAFRNGKGFAINILSGEQQGLSGRFASSSIADKFEGVAWEAGINGMPVLSHCAATFECTTFAVHDAGDHWLFLGQVRRFEHEISHHPLVFCKGAYMLLSKALLESSQQSTERIAEVVEARRLIHGALLELACRNATEEDFKALDAKLLEMERFAEEGAPLPRVEAGVEFFRLIGAATHNEIVATLANSLADVMRQNLNDAAASPPRSALVPLRREILKHLQQRDRAAAEEALGRYLALLVEPNGRREQTVSASLAA